MVTVQRKSSCQALPFNMRRFRSRVTHAVWHVGLTPSRVLTSHARRHYETQYRGQRRYPRLAFLFDLCIFSAAAVLVVINIVLRLLPPGAPPGLQLIVAAPEIVAGAPQAFEARIVSRDMRTLEQVSLVWEIPDGMEVTYADPPLTHGKEALLGSVRSGETKVARIAVRTFTPPGSLKIGFRVRSGAGELVGQDVRPVVRSGLEFAPLMEVAMLAPDAAIPYRIRNATSQPMDRVEVLALQGARVEGRDRWVYEKLSPGEEHILFLQPNMDHGLKVYAMVHGVPLVIVDRSVPLASRMSARVIDVASDAVRIQARVITTLSTVSRLRFVHPCLADDDFGQGWKDILLDQDGRGEMVLSADVKDGCAAQERWFAFPYDTVDGGIVLGTALFESVPTVPIVRISARYFASNGDQMGIGSLPPKIGEGTSYWIEWKMISSGRTIHNIKLQADLGAGVSLTGRDALRGHGAISQGNDRVIWTLPALAAGSEPVTAAFEILLRPTEAMRGKVPLFHGPVRLSATDSATGLPLTGVFGPGPDAQIMDDEKARGKGMVE